MRQISAHLLEQRSRGQVFLKSSNPDEIPGIDPQMLEDSGDLQAMTSAMEFIMDLVRGYEMEEFYGRLIQPASSRDFANFARSTYDSYHHGAGTCKMGPASDRTAVVDEQLRVHGMANLWIADASIMPTVTHANTNLTVIMIAERGSQILNELA
jgi:choline dehydrogenase